MASLIGIIIFHLVILYRAQTTKDKAVPYGSIFFFTLLLVTFVLFMMVTIEEPEQLGY